MRLDSTQPLGFFSKVTSMNPIGIGSYTKANSYALTSPSRSVETKAFGGFNQLIMLKFKTGTGNQTRTWNAFTMNTASSNVNCKATANPNTASATASWTISWTVSYDPNPNGTVPTSSGSILGTVTSTGTNDTYNLNPSADSIAQLKATNPLIYDDVTPANRIYLFEKRDPTTGNITQKGYLTDIVPLRNPATSVSADGRTASASIDGALRIDTAALNPAVPETATSISLLRSSCEAVDNR
jgi:hypothetical protein